MDSAWDVFGLLMIVLGGLGVLMRIPMVFSPSYARGLLRWALRHRLFIHVAMLVVAIVGACFIWAARELPESQLTDFWPVFVMLALGILMAVTGLVFLGFPKLYVGMAAYIKACSDTTIRLLAMLGVLVAALIASAGVIMLL